MIVDDCTKSLGISCCDVTYPPPQGVKETEGFPDKAPCTIQNVLGPVYSSGCMVANHTGATIEWFFRGSINDFHFQFQCQFDVFAISLFQKVTINLSLCIGIYLLWKQLWLNLRKMFAFYHVWNKTLVPSWLFEQILLKYKYLWTKYWWYVKVTKLDQNLKKYVLFWHLTAVPKL